MQEKHSFSYSGHFFGGWVDPQFPHLVLPPLWLCCCQPLLCLWPGPLKPFFLNTASTSVDSGLLIFCRKFLLSFSVSMVLSTVLAITKHCARVLSALILSNRASLTLEFWLWVRNRNFTNCEATFPGDLFHSPHEVTLRLAQSRIDSTQLVPVLE